ALTSAKSTLTKPGIVMISGLVNVDFADVKAVMADAGSALMGIGIGSGKSRSRDAANAAISSPLLESSIEGAQGVVLNITGGSDLTLHEVNSAAEAIYEVVDPNANIIFGAVLDDRLQGEIRITVIATGFSSDAPINIVGSTPKTKAGPAATAAGRTAPTPPRFPSQSQAAPIAPPVVPERPASTDGLDIPEFLQRRRNNPNPGQ
ncbi:MAG: cell division protein FtsZ, partial [Cyanobacteria bacterium P01_D01_bin.73]